MSNSREEQVFTEALEYPAAERGAFLRGACAGDDALRRGVEALLEAHASPATFLDVPPARPRPATGGALEHTGDRIGRYRLVELLGEGGCGSVYLAEQEEPVRRRVALKIIKPGMDTRHVVARFELERQALALMEHPNIAHVFDAGATDAGRPYFVMELVQGGEPITAYCDHRQLAPRRRLVLFLQVCRAVQHAHHKGIIHRDLKPSNILVTEGEHGGIPKVIDFGIAKATEGPLVGDAGARLEQLVGTPVYMSPEQTSGGAGDLDPRSDIYSLGVLLYELLTGRPPFDPEFLARGGVDGVRRILQEVDPPRPSTRVDTLTGPDRAMVAALRSTAPAQLGTSLRGDLDAVVMKALQKERHERYHSVAAFADDLERCLRHEPVLARPPRVGYLLRRYLRRHWQVSGLLAAFTAILALAALLDTALVIRTVLVFFAVAALASSVLAARATRARLRMERVTRVFHRILDALGPTVALNPHAVDDRDHSRWQNVLEQTSDEILNELKSEPDIGAEVAHLLGKIHLAARQLPQAEAVLRQAVAFHREAGDTRSLRAAETMYDFAIALLRDQNFAEAEPHFRTCLAIRRVRLGREHPEFIRTLEDLGFGTWASGDNLAAEAMLREALELRRKTGALERLDNPLMAPLWTLGVCLSHLDQFEEAVALARQNLEFVERRLDRRHRFVANAHELLADCHTRHGDYPEALASWRTALDLRRSHLPSDHVSLVFPLWGMAHCLHRLNDLDAAEPLYREALDLWRRKQPPHHREIIPRLTGLAELLVRREAFSEAQSLLDEAWDKLQQPAHASWLEFHAEVLAGQLELHAAWARREPSHHDGATLWRDRLREFERATEKRPAGPDHVNALRGLVLTYRQWTRRDLTKAAKTLHWQTLLQECWEKRTASGASPRRRGAHAS